MKVITNKELLQFVRRTTISEQLSTVTDDIMKFTAVLNNFMGPLNSIGAADKVNKLLMSATDSEDLRHIFQVVEVAESRPVNLDRLNIQELRLYCNAFDYKYNECLTNSFDMWSEVFGTEFNDCVRKEIMEYIENCD